MFDIDVYEEYYKNLTPTGLRVIKYGDRIVIDGFDNEFKKGGNVKTWRNKYNEKYGYSKNASHDLDEISKDTGISIKGLQQIYNKGVGAFKTNPSSVRPNVKSKEQWAMGRVYSAVMGGKASKVDAKELKMETGGLVEDLISKGIVELKMFDTKPEHAKEYGFDVKNPLYIQSLCITESERLKGTGKKVLDYIDEYAVNNGHDLIFGNITQKAEFTKDSRNNDFCDIDLIKEFLRKAGYNTIMGNNDFYKYVETNTDIRFDEGGAIGVQTSKLIEELKKYSNYEQGEISTNAEGEKYRYHYWKLKYRSASNWLVQLFMRASLENTGVDYKQRFAVGDYSFYYDRPEMKGKPNGSMQMRKLEVLGKYEKGGINWYGKGGIKERFAEGGQITQYEVEAMQEYIKDPNSNPKMVKSFTQVLNKFGADVDTDSKRYDVGKYIDTYNFQGYEYMEEQNQKMGVKFLLTGEYKLVSKAIYERDYSMWLYYNYLGRISISFEDMQNWLNEAIDYFKYTLPIDILLKHTPYAKDGRSYCLVFAGSRSQVLSTIGEEPKYEYEGTYYYTEIGMVGIGDSKDGGWGEFYRERKTGLTIPEYQKTAFHFNTLIHEFAHALDFQKQFLENINKRNERQMKLERGEIDKVELTELEKQIYGDSFKNKKEGLVEFPIVNHFDYFIDSLIEILRASASGNIPLSYIFEKQALQVQTALSGVYGDLLLEQRERKRKEALMVRRDDETRDNKRFTWQSKVVSDVKEYVLSNAIQDGLKEALKSKTKPFTLTEILEYDNLISNYVEDRYKPLMIESPQRATALLDSLKEIKKETNRIINNHYDNIINKFAYGFRPENDLDKFLLINCKDNMRNYKNWKECSKEIISSKL
jgi:hypothetical protein